LKYKLALLATAALLAPASAAFAQAHPAPPPPPQSTEQPTRPPERGTSVEGVTVNSDQNRVRADIDRRSYSIANDLQATTGSVADALRGVPGVQVDVQGNVSLRGDQNVTILVDGKPSGMFNGDGRADALMSMPADRIDRVEVMTNPSAAFSPEGTAGIINLVTRRTPVRQAARSASVRGNVGTEGRYNGGVSGSSMNGPLTVSGDLGVRHDRQFFTVEDERDRFDSGLGVFVPSQQAVDSQGEGDMANARASLDYDLDPKTRFSTELRYRTLEFNADTDEAYVGEDGFGTVDTINARSVDSSFARDNGGGFVRLRRQFDGQEHDLTGDLSYERTTGERRSQALTSFILPAMPDAYEDIRNSFAIDTWRLKVDYNRPLADEAKLKAGTDFEFTSNDFDNRGERGPSAGSTTPVAALTNRFLYDQNVQAFYATYQRPFGPLTAQLGLRLESVEIDINQVTTGITDENSYRGFYPTLHLTWDLSDTQQLSASYSRRIQRPGAGDLNPYVVYIDPFNLRAGNPDLKPQITDSYEAAWQVRKGSNFYLLTAFWRDSRDGVTDVVTDLGGGVFLTTRENLTQNRSGGLEFIANGKITPTLSYNVTGNAFWNEIDGSGFLGGQDRDGWSMQGFGQLSWQATPNDFLQLSGHLMGDRLIPQGEIKGGGMMNLGYRHKFNDRFSGVVTVQDIFKTARFEQVIDTPLIHERSRRDFDFQSVYVGFTWNFGAPRRQPERFDFDTGAVGPG
jgi:outer membrane receptor protein involved in Fe transport